jgi:histidine triad (HIT) family protein
MDDCIFCKIVAGEIPAYKVHENEHFLAFLDIHPQSPGHVQVIPKKHYRWVWDVPQIGEYFEIVRSIALAEREAFSTEWILSKIVGDEVSHAHIWVFPSNEAKGDKNDFENNAEKLRVALLKS